MKKLKKFEMYSRDNIVDDGVGVAGDDVFQTGYLSPGDFRNTLEKIFSLPLELKTKKIADLTRNHPEVKKDKDLSLIWWEYVKKWHIEVNQAVKDDPSMEDKLMAITNKFKNNN